MKAALTAQRLRLLLDYDETTGVFTWSSRIHNEPQRYSGRLRKTRIAGTILNGYVVIRIDGRGYKSHRLAWLYTHGEWPTHEIDHIDGNKTNNAIANLRDVTRTVNAQNLHKPSKRNTSGYIGVHRYGQQWRAYIGASNKLIYLGAFNDKEEAKRAYDDAKRIHHVGHAHANLC